MPRRRLHGPGRTAPFLVLLLVLLLMVLPPFLLGVEARPFTGAGQTGSVPVGEGGETVPFLADLADDRIFVAIGPVPGDTCRLVLDTNGTYGETGLHWAEGDETAYVWADHGARDAPYRLHAVWSRDLNDNCTVERTEETTHWHDPRGRPFVELRILEHRPLFPGPAGTTIRVDLTIQNNGTLSDNVSAEIGNHPKEFRVTAATPILTVPVDPLEQVVFSFDVEVPWETRAGVYPLVVDFESESGWSGGITAFPDVGPPEGEDPRPHEDKTPDPAAADPLAPPTLEPNEAPLVHGLLLLVVTVGLVGLLRRRA